MRDVARVLLLDHGNHILLIKGSDPTNPELDHWWFTPGGGVNEGESHQQAASRELFEETGLELEITGNPIWERIASFEFMGTLFHQRELFFVARAERFEPRPQYLSEAELQYLLGSKWWSKDELAATRETFFPADLAERFEDLVNPGTLGTIKLPDQEIKLPKKS